MKICRYRNCLEMLHSFTMSEKNVLLSLEDLPLSPDCQPRRPLKTFKEYRPLSYNYKTKFIHQTIL